MRPLPQSVSRPLAVIAASGLVWACSAEPGLPGAFRLGLPADGATVAGESVTFTWSPSTGALGYVLELDGMAIDVGDAAQFTLLEGLPPKTQHTWQVTASGRGGAVGAS